MDKTLMVLIAFLLGLTLLPPIIEHVTLLNMDEDEQQLVIKPEKEDGWFNFF